MARRPVVLSLAALVALVLAVSAYAAYSGVTRVRIVVNPKFYRGPCPATLTFTGTIFVRRPPVRVEYMWTRSDGATGPRQSLVINSAGQGVTDTWTLGSRGMRMNVWEQLHVLAPTGINSPTAHVRVNCR
ncbi:MAG TPA: hypothetical protein VEZ11_07255 [Thermoanaerobaculia bacterium]|nr:hypothetical protein [Thermoanaerobaculia bacterium]